MVSLTLYYQLLQNQRHLKKLDQGERHPLDFSLKEGAPPNPGTGRNLTRAHLSAVEPSSLFQPAGGHTTMQHQRSNPGSKSTAS